MSTMGTCRFCSYMYISETKIKKIFISKFEDQDCYELAKQAAEVTVDPESTITLPTVIYPASSLSKKLNL